MNDISNSVQSKYSVTSVFGVIGAYGRKGSRNFTRRLGCSNQIKRFVPFNCIDSETQSHNESEFSQLVDITLSAPFHIFLQEELPQVLDPLQ